MAEPPLNQPSMNTTDDDGDDSSDSGSDISMDSESEDEQDQPPTIISTSDSKKRKLATPEEEGESNGFNGEITAKRVKASKGSLPEDKSLLPAEIWHNIFTFVPPRSLGALLQVNKAFNSYLDPSSTFSRPAATLPTSIKFLDPDSIWQASRVLYRPGIPSPLAGLSELEMWKHAYQKSCQFCPTKAAPDLKNDQWHSGPGAKGVRTIWSFAIRTCGSCLMEKSMKEIDLLLSPSEPALLIPALPFVFITNENHVVSQAALQSGVPPNVQIAKYFFKPHIDDMKAEFFKAKELGTAAAEEWIKGLDDLGKDRRNDASRWERFEAQGGLHRMLAVEAHEKPVMKPSSNVLAPSLPAPVNSAITGVTPAQQGNSRPSSVVQAVSQAVQVPAMAHFTTSNPPGFSLPAPNGFGLPRPAPHQRTKEEAAEMKAARKAEIERRAALLEPPLPAAVLAHMSSYQAALHIIKPLDDAAWELLKPRLLSQRAEAEQREKDRLLQTKLLQEVVDRQLPADLQTKDPEKEWDDVQAPLRARIAGFADEIVRDGWANGTKVTHDNSPQFAAEVLIYVRKRFYAEIAKDAAAIRAAGQEPKADPPHGPYTQKLILENMKWIFDCKIKPHTEQYRKELFLCNGCEGNSKFYGFEGVIQHYAAKHTNSLSQGSIVVHWKAEWPEFPPFHPDPTQAKTQYSLPNSATYPNQGLPDQGGYGWTGYPSTSASVPNQAAVSHGYPQNPYAPQNGFQNRNPAVQGAPYVGNGQPYQPPPQREYAQPPGFGPQYPNNSQQVHDPRYPPQHYPPPMESMGAPNASYPPPTGNFASSQAPVDPRVPIYQGSSAMAQPPPQITQQNPAYRTQLEFVAHTAREIWNSTSGIKEMPGSVRVYVIIHHVVNRSRGQFPNEPPLSMFIDGLSNNKEMRPVRNVNGLSCKTCNSDPSRAIPGEKKSFSVPQLFNHFQNHHTNQSDGSPSNLYWVNDMVQLPEMSKISALLYTPGMDDYKLKLVADIFPMAFPSPLPRVEAARAAVAQSESYHRNSKSGGRPKNGKERHNNYSSNNNTGFESGSGYVPPENGSTNYGNFGRPDSRNRNNDYSQPADVYGPGRTTADTYNSRSGGYPPNDQSINDILRRQANSTPSYGKKKSGRGHNAATSLNDDQTRPAQNRQSSMATSSIVERAIKELTQSVNPEKAAQEAEEQERLQEEALRASWKAERIDSMRRMYQPTADRSDAKVDSNPRGGSVRPLTPEQLRTAARTQQIPDRHPSQPRHDVVYDYEDRLISGSQRPQYGRERTPELVDHRYKLNDAVYRDERQPSYGPSHGIPPGRYPRHETGRLESDRARSRSPVYVKVGPQTTQYRDRERSPPLHLSQTESNHRRTSPQSNNIQDVGYEYDRERERERLPPPREYYYAEEIEREPIRRNQPPPPFAEPYEFIRVADPQGDYMIRRPVQEYLPLRREAVYAHPHPQYEDDLYSRQPAYATSTRDREREREVVYEPRGVPDRVGGERDREMGYERMGMVPPAVPVSRNDPAYYEEYDPRNPAPLPSSSVRQARH